MRLPHKGLALGAAGLVAGLALGATGFAQAADPTPTPSPQLKQRMHDRMGGPMGGKLREHLRGVGGLVTAIDGDSLTVRTPSGTETFGLTSSTVYYEGKTASKRSAINKGDVVHVRVVDPRATKKVAAVVMVVPAHLDGWVTKVDSDTITITDRSGFTRTIRTSSATTYSKDGATAKRSAITVGALVRAVGEVDADGTTLDATRVATGRPSKADRMGPADGPGMRPGPAGAPMTDSLDEAPGDAPIA